MFGITDSAVLQLAEIGGALLAVVGSFLVFAVAMWGFDQLRRLFGFERWDQKTTYPD